MREVTVNYVNARSTWILGRLIFEEKNIWNDVFYVCVRVCVYIYIKEVIED